MRPPVRVLVWAFASMAGALALVVATNIVVSHHTHTESEAWLHALFHGSVGATPSAATSCSESSRKIQCSFSKLSAVHGGADRIDCYDNAPMSPIGWECRVSFNDGSHLLVETSIGWSERWAHAYIGYY